MCVCVCVCQCAKMGHELREALNKHLELTCTHICVYMFKHMCVYMYTHVCVYVCSSRSKTTPIVAVRHNQKVCVCVVVVVVVVVCVRVYRCYFEEQRAKRARYRPSDDYAIRVYIHTCIHVQTHVCYMCYMTNKYIYIYIYIYV